jgi:exonuclease III
MKIISWNCAGALRKKTNYVDQFDADILVIQECEDPERSTKAYKDWSGEYLWYGDNKNKGIGIFARNGQKTKKLDWSKSYSQKGFANFNPSKTWSSEELKLFLPSKINDDITLLGVWTKKNKSDYFSYIGQFWKYLQIHRSDLSHGRTIVCGDFNSNMKWDKSDSWWNHTDVINELENIGIHSVYHQLNNEKQGEEIKPTLYHQKNIEKKYHVDYAFISDDLISDCSIEIGERKDWIKISDHMPLVMTITD